MHEYSKKESAADLACCGARESEFPESSVRAKGKERGREGFNFPRLRPLVGFVLPGCLRGGRLCWCSGRRGGGESLKSALIRVLGRHPRLL